MNNENRIGRYTFKREDLCAPFEFEFCVYSFPIELVVTKNEYKSLKYENLKALCKRIVISTKTNIGVHIRKYFINR